MDPTTLGLALVATIDLCLKYGRRLMEACETYKNAETIMKEKALEVEARWARIDTQMTLIREMHSDFGQELHDLYSRMFDLLEVKMKVVTRKFDELHNQKTRVNRWKLVTKKECLEEAIAQLGAWETLFNPSWMFLPILASRSSSMQEQLTSLIARLPVDDATTFNSLLNKRLIAEHGHDKGVTFTDDPLATARKVQILQSSAQAVYDPKSGGLIYILESIACSTGSNTNTFLKNARAITSRLLSIDPIRIGVLQSKGIIRKRDGDTLTVEIVLRLPPGFHDSSRSFRTLLNSGNEHSLTERLRIAKQLARAICYIHTLDFVHKNIRPESILWFDQADETQLASVFLVGFQRYRSAEGQTHLQELSSWHFDLYRHPDRQGEHPEKAYVFQHDIYSLGVCLLEIGLWCSFVSYKTEEGPGPEPNPMIAQTTDFFKEPIAVKDKLLSVTSDYLPHRMGDKFTRVVYDCLTCLDPQNSHFADHAEFEDADGVLIGVKYIEKILLELESIVM